MGSVNFHGVKYFTETIIFFSRWPWPFSRREIFHGGRDFFHGVFTVCLRNFTHISMIFLHFTARTVKIAIAWNLDKVLFALRRKFEFSACKKMKILWSPIFFFVILFAEDANFFFSDRCQLVTWSIYFQDVVNCFRAKFPVEFVKEKCSREMFLWRFFVFCFTCKTCSCYISN